MTEKKSPPQPDPWGRIYRCGWVALGRGGSRRQYLRTGSSLTRLYGDRCFRCQMLSGSSLGYFLKREWLSIFSPLSVAFDFHTFHFWDSCADSIDVFGLLLSSLFLVTLAFSVVGMWRFQLGREHILWKERCCPVRKLSVCWLSVFRRCFFFFLLATVRRKLLLLTFLLRLTLLSYFHS